MVLPEKWGNDPENPVDCFLVIVEVRDPKQVAMNGRLQETQIAKWSQTFFSAK